MDPFSLSVGIVSLVGFVAQTLVLAKDYMSGIKHAKESVITLITELEALQSNLSSLDEFLRSDSVRIHGLAFQRTSVLRSCASACEGKLKSLCKKLGRVGDSRTSRYLWPLSEKEHQKTVQEIRAFTQWMQFALSVDGCSLLSRTSDDVLKIMGQQLESFKSLQSVEEQTAQIKEAIIDQRRFLQDDYNAKTRNNILNWISKLDHDQNQKHHAIRLPRVEGTGGWLLERLEYVRWRDEVSGSSVLWCHGIQGSGKSVLTSMVIDDLQSSLAGPESLVAFFYFDYRDQDHQTPANLLSSILRQIIATMPEVPKCVADAYEKSHGPSASLPLYELEKMIHTITSTNVRRLYIIIDALDECDESRHRRVVLQLLSRIKQDQAIRLFVTSRQYPQDINAAFHTQPQIAIHAHESDLRRYMYEELDHTNVNDIVDSGFASKLVEMLINNAQGMFLLPILQLRTVLKEPTAGEMEDALASLSRSLPEAFEETIARIQRLPESRRRLGISALMWICHAKRPLAVSELSEALSVRHGQTNLSLKHCPSPKIIVECCQGLVTLDSKSKSIRLAHYAIQEYLIGHSQELFPSADGDIAATCLIYLLFDAFKEGPCFEEGEIKSRIEKNPFLLYACRYWGRHVVSCEADGFVQQLASAYLSSHSAVAQAYQIMEFGKQRREEYWTPEECFSVTALHHACYFGLEKTVRQMLDQGAFHIDARTKMGTTPLIKAACASPAGHVSIVQMLLERGANPCLGNWYGNALHCAAEAGCSATIRQLVDHGMNPNESEHDSLLPIYCTLDNDRSAAFETLIDLGADMKLGNESGLSIFHQAALDSCVNIIDVILQRRWADLESKTIWGLTPMHFAARGGNIVIVSRLLEAGADINARDYEGKTPLHYANKYGNQDIVILLLDRGADLVQL